MLTLTAVRQPRWSICAQDTLTNCWLSSGAEGSFVHCSYARQKFAEKHEVRPEMSLAALAPMLPHTRAWLAQASGQLLSLHSHLPASSSSSVSPLLLHPWAVGSTVQGSHWKQVSVTRGGRY